MGCTRFFPAAITAAALLAPALVAAQCTGALIGQSVYTIQNDTANEQYVFVSARDEPVDSDSWRRLVLPATRASLTAVDFSDGQYVILVNVVNGRKQARKYQMECKQRYLLRRDTSSGLLALMRLGE